MFGMSICITTLKLYKPLIINNSIVIVNLEEEFTKKKMNLEEKTSVIICTKWTLGRIYIVLGVKLYIYGQNTLLVPKVYSLSVISPWSLKWALLVPQV